LKELQDGLPDILADPGQISQVLDNIIINALNAMGGEGTLKVATGLSARWLLVYITDNGPGIPEKNISRIFDPFFTTKASGEGTGLGLSTCDRIISEHGGTIAVYSIPGKETTFLIKLPVTEQEMARIERKRMFEETSGETPATVSESNPDADDGKSSTGNS
jgi:two-component system NtrC family sensor kinase